MEQKYKETLIGRIIELLKQCNDIGLLAIILKLLEKGM